MASEPHLRANGSPREGNYEDRGRGKSAGMGIRRWDFSRVLSTWRGPTESKKSVLGAQEGVGAQLAGNRDPGWLHCVPHRSFCWPDKRLDDVEEFWLRGSSSHNLRRACS